jgi:DNA-binding transcriptional LysR family regulator
MEHRQILNFLAVCEERNFTKAAEKRHITQQGLSFSIRELEREIGVEFFDRRRRGAILTEYGMVLEQAARAYTNQHDYILETLKSMKEKTKSRLSVGLASETTYAFPPHFFHDFIAAYPDISLSLKTFTLDNYQQYVLEQRLQIGFSLAPIDMDNFDAIQLVKVKTNLLVGCKHQLANRKSVTLSDLRKKDVITFMISRYPFLKLLEICQQNDIHTNTQLGAFDVELITELCETGRFAVFWGGPEIPKLKIIKIDDLDLTAEFYLVVNRRAFKNEAMETFIEYTKKRFLV